MQRRIRAIKKDQSGFTLIELLIVIVILGILAAVVVFAVGAFNKNGQQAACQSDFKSVETADEAYFAKNQAYATSPTQLWPNYLKEWPQTTNGDPASPVLKPVYTIGLAATSPNVTIGGTTTTDASGCSALS
jgi:prepilin-type N-terminal cleavage/methylation domain-containing protein